MLLTVAICTWNRANLLDATLAQLRRATPPAGEWEVVVVNNNSTDDTVRVIEAHAGHLPIVPLFEPNPGLSNARNAAMAAARGDWIAWTDDDVLVAEDWLVAYAAAMQAHSDAAFLGGPIRPWFDGTPPSWLTAVWDDVASAYATRDLGAQAFPIRDVHKLPFGANFAVRRTAQLQFPFDPGLGRKLKGGALGEESVVMGAMLRAGMHGWWVPEATVRHWVPRERQTIAYLRSYYRLLGRTDAVEDEDHPAPRIFGGPRWAWRQAVTAECRYRLMRLFGGPQDWVDPLKQASKAWGIVRPAA